VMSRTRMCRSAIQFNAPLQIQLLDTVLHVDSASTTAHIDHRWAAPCYARTGLVASLSPCSHLTCCLFGRA
jgi:hypothetical protein